MTTPKINRVLHAPNRLRICALLTAAEEVEFQKVRYELAVSNSVLSKHLKHLIDAGYVRQRRRKRDGRLHTWLRLTASGAQAFEAHAAELHRLTEPAVRKADDMPEHPGSLDPTIGRPVRRKRQIDHARLAQAVLAVGFEHLTITSVAKHLGTAHSAVYHHVKDRSALLGLAVDHLVNNTAWPAPKPSWSDTLREHSMTLWELLDRHPGLAFEMTVHSMPALSYQRLIHKLMHHLESLGFSAQQALLAVDLVMDLTIDASLRAHFQQIRFPADDPNAFRDWFLQKVHVVLAGIDNLPLAASGT